MGGWAVAVGLVGVVGNIVWPFFRGRRTMLVVQGLAAACFAAHYGLIAANTAGLLLLAAALQAFAAIPLGRDPRFRLVYLATLPLIAAAMVLSWQGLPSAFSATGFALISLGRYQVDVIRFRAILLACIPFWIVHNLMVGSVPGLLSDVIGFSSGAWMLVVAIRESRAPATA